MRYQIVYKPRAAKDIQKLSRQQIRRVLAAIERLADNLQGDVKRLTQYTPEYRLRVGEYRVLFEIEDDQIVIYRIRHRKDAYR